MAARFELTLAPGDLAKVQFAVSPMQHLILGLQDDTLSTQRWMRRVSGRIPGSAREFVHLVTRHPSNYIPDFLTPAVARTRAAGKSAIDDELDRITATPAGQLADELQPFISMPDPPTLALELREGGTTALAQLADTIHAVYLATLAEDWPDIARHLTGDISHRLSHQGERGTREMLAGVHWRMREMLGLRLELDFPVPGPIAPWETYVSPGKGLLIAPNLFLDGALAPSLSPWQPPQLLYPARTAVSTKPGWHADPLVTLLGRGRAAALRAVATGCTTAELAVRLEVTAPTASVQAAALREAGLLATTREGRSVRHTLTPLGSALLEANPEHRSQWFQ